ncbi:MAG TPA: asparagine synthase (glutamine-hydrolyzing) [Chitinophagaceae bacterium]|nr:asparagine synthase (glutamine-hydrolyzing) [Chitinophagaceae bacterium]
MCGISGFLDYSRRSDESVLQKMNDTLFHRGPDGYGLKLFDTGNALLGFGHRRLSIIDLSEGGKQPMHYGWLSITYNGEVYNFMEIRSELEKMGHEFESHSDTEVILHSYAEWGSDCVHRFIGMFAFVIYDHQKQELFCARDRAGVKPFFYYHHQDLFLFASELKAIVAHPAFKKSLNRNAIAAFLQYGYVPTPHCIYNDTHKLKPGFVLYFRIAKNELHTHSYWNVYDAYNKAPLDLSFEEARDATEKLLISACNYRMVSDVPVGVFLSGGYDSTTVTALLQKDRTEKIKTFTIGVPDAGLNEAPYAREVAEYLGTDHTEYYCTAEEALNIIPSLPFYYDEPFADSSAIPTSLVSRIAREKVTVALSADAGDELFAGYNRYDYIMKFGAKVKRIPPVIRRSIAGAMNLVDANSIPVLRNKYLFHSRYEKVKHFLRESSDRSMNQILSSQFNEHELQDLLLHATHPLHTAFESTELKAERYSTLHYIMAIDYQTYLVDDILQKVDRAAMIHSLEGREPFLDHRIIEWAATLPETYKYHEGTKKYILREIAHRYVPKQLLDRPKMGFGIPIEKWLRVELRPLVEEYFSENYLQKQQVFQIKAVRKLITSFYDGKTERAEKIWYLLMFQMWFEQWGK